MRRLSKLFTKTSIKSADVVDVLRVKATDPPSSTVLDLPIEILLAVESFLAYEHAIAFSLTCKKAYKVFFERNRPWRFGHHRDERLLFLLERDQPHLLTCPMHKVLYDWRKQRGKRYRCPQLCGVGDSMVICNKGCKVGFMGIFDAERRLIIRHTFLGPEYGVSMRSLNHVCKRGKSKMSNEVTPKRAGNTLMIWRTHHYTAPLDFVSWKDLNIGHDFNEAVCVHSDGRLRALAVACIVRARKRRRWLLQASTPQRNYMKDLMSWHSPILFKCGQCTTDVRVRIDQISPDRINIQFDVFQDLGGLDQMTLAQYQVLGTRSGLTSRSLNRRDKIQRLCEDLQKRYFEQDETAERYHDGIPWHVAILGQWWYSFSYDGDDIVFGRRDEHMPKAIWLRHQHIPFIRERDRVKS